MTRNNWIKQDTTFHYRFPSPKLSFSFPLFLLPLIVSVAHLNLFGSLKLWYKRKREKRERRKFWDIVLSKRYQIRLNSLLSISFSPLASLWSEKYSSECSFLRLFQFFLCPWFFGIRSSKVQNFGGENEEAKDENFCFRLIFLCSPLSHLLEPSFHSFFLCSLFLSR